MHSIKEIENGEQLQEVLRKLNQLNVTVEYTKKIFRKPYLRILFGDEFMISRQLFQTGCIELKNKQKITAINIDFLKRIQPVLDAPYESPVSLDGYSIAQAHLPYSLANDKQIKAKPYFNKLPPMVKENNESEQVNETSESIKISPRR